jgi:hypothetical protein
MAIATKKTGFAGLACPFCGQSEEGIKIDLHTMDIECSACSEEFDAQGAVEKARETLEQWGGVAKWVEASRGL